MGALPTARRALIVAPHPDDEAIAACGLISSLLRQGTTVEVLVVSDGGASHPGSRRWHRLRLVAERRRETLRAMRGLGLTPHAVTFLGLPDGSLASAPKLLERRLGRALRPRRAPDLIVGPETTDDHADHRAVACALASIRRQGERRLGYHVWPVDAARGARPYRVVLKAAALAIKRRIVRSYRTQAGAIMDSPTGFRMTHRHFKAFAAPIEQFAVIR